MAIVNADKFDWQTDLIIEMKHNISFIIVKHTPQNVLTVRNFIYRNIVTDYGHNNMIPSMSDYITIIITSHIDRSSVKITANPEMAIIPTESNYNEKFMQLNLRMEFTEQQEFNKTKVIINYSTLHNTTYIKKEDINTIITDPLIIAFGLGALMILSSMLIRH